MAEENREELSVGMAASADRVVPKFCTAINIALLNNRNIILSMIYNEGKDNITLIDRVVIDIEHAASLNKALGDILKDVGYDAARSED